MLAKSAKFYPFNLMLEKKVISPIDIPSNNVPTYLRHHTYLSNTALAVKRVSNRPIVELLFAILWFREVCLPTDQRFYSLQRHNAFDDACILL